MTKIKHTEAALKTANELIAYLVNALSNIERNGNIHYAHGAAELAIKHATLKMTRNADGYLEVHLNARPLTHQNEGHL